MSVDDDIARWESTVPIEITSDVLWRNAAYRLATYASDFIWPDISALAADVWTARIAGQLFEAVGSIGANYSEGYSRGTDRDRCRLYEYAFGSAREARDWCYKTRHVIGPERTSQFLSLLTRIIQLLTVTIVRERSRNSRLGAEAPAKRAKHSLAQHATHAAATDGMVAETSAPRTITQTHSNRADSTRKT